MVNGRGGRLIPIGSTLSFRDLERSLSLTSWIVSFSNFWMRKRRVWCCSWGGFLFLRLYLGSFWTLVFMSLDNSPSSTYHIFRRLLYPFHLFRMMIKSFHLFKRLVKPCHIFRRLVKSCHILRMLFKPFHLYMRWISYFLGGFNPFYHFRRLVTPFLLEVNDSQSNSWQVKGGRRG